MRSTTALSILLLFINLTSCKEIKPPAENNTAPLANETSQSTEPTVEVDMPEAEFPEPGTESVTKPKSSFIVPGKSGTVPTDAEIRAGVKMQSRNRKAAAELEKELGIKPRAGVPSFVTPQVNDAGECEALTLMGYIITDDVIRKISEMDALTINFSLNECEVTDEQIGQLANMKSLKSLRSIEFSSAPLTGSSLGMLKGCDKLEVLSLSGCPNLTIDQLPPLPALTKLNLLECRMVTDKDIPKLASMKNLETLNLYNTSITPAGIAKLKELLPNCKISHN
ncbi:Leucine Rich repeats (2 copies) [Gimesia algae]|uniref:Leucine Rich repeats (2 copies) n=2 Tax=Gimesia algae TaxID=2527971 RepID=A0A517VD06_9PLAN|nr:Leucine Rich repeats (2 copies) [Gimesia algae]